MQSTRNFIIEPIGLDADSLPRPISWPAMFGNDHPVELEIGSGKGTFLLEQAKTLPDTNFFGIEWARWFWMYASDRLRRNNCLNARMVRAEAGFFMREHIADASLNVVHIYFPDPWPKARHHKRRLIQLPFLKEVHRILVPGGKLRLVTDHADYFAHMKQTLEAQQDLKIISFDSPVAPPNAAGQNLIVGTNFEKKYVAEGRSFNAIAAEKPLTNPPSD